MEILEQMIFITDLKGNLETLKATEKDVLIIKISPINGVWPTQSELNEIADFMKTAFTGPNLLKHIVFLPDFYKMCVLTEANKEEFRKHLKEADII